jgi:phosphoglucosamine mutase
LSDETEREIEALVTKNHYEAQAAPNKLGRAKRLDDAPGRYIEFAKNTFPKSLTLEGLKIVVDCANGAGYQVAPLILRELGAQVVAIGVEPDGFNINKDCGSTSPKAMCERVVKEKANLGIALDGDADRLAMCGENGALLDGDQLLAMIATQAQAAGTLKGGCVVATDMSNMGLERYLEARGLKLARTKVGDRYVVERMRETGCNIGGEQSGHIILSDHATTGDGIIASLQTLAYMIEDGRPLSQCGRLFSPLPQILKNVPYRGPSPLKEKPVQQAIESEKSALGDKGRIFIRESGTEPLIRVMVEGNEKNEVEAVTEKLVRLLSA